MRIFHILPTSESNNPYFNGAVAQVARYLDRELNLLGYQSKIFECSDLQSSVRSASYFTPPINWLSKTQVLLRILFTNKRVHTGSGFTLKDEIEEDDIIIVHNNPWLLYRIYHCYPKNRIYLYVHNEIVRRLPNFLKRRLLEPAAGLISISNFIQIQLECMKLSKRILVIQNSTSNEIKPEHNLSFKERNIDIFFAARLAPEKGLHIFINALTKYLDSPSGLRIQIAGSDSHNKDTLSTRYAKKQIARAESIGIEYLGRLQHDQIIMILANSKFSIIPSIWDEPFSLFALESIRAGAIPIYFESGGISEATLKQGFPIKKKTAKTLAKVIRAEILPLIQMELEGPEMRFLDPGYNWKQNAKLLGEFVAAK